MGFVNLSSQVGGAYTGLCPGGATFFNFPITMKLSPRSSSALYAHITGETEPTRKTANIDENKNEENTTITTEDNKDRLMKSRN